VKIMKSKKKGSLGIICITAQVDSIFVQTILWVISDGEDDSKTIIQSKIRELSQQR
jgi:hypothetical protein